MMHEEVKDKMFNLLRTAGLKKNREILRTVFQQADEFFWQKSSTFLRSVEIVVFDVQFFSIPRRAAKTTLLVKQLTLICNIY